jgi:hypothetical protein
MCRSDIGYFELNVNTIFPARVSGFYSRKVLGSQLSRVCDHARTVPYAYSAVSTLSRDPGRSTIRLL